jgi:hypothetical protein
MAGNILSLNRASGNNLRNRGLDRTYLRRARFFSNKLEVVAIESGCIDRSDGGAAGGDASVRSAGGGSIGSDRSTRSTWSTRVRCLASNNVVMRSDRAGTVLRAARRACILNPIAFHAICRSRRPIAKRRTPTSNGSNNAAISSSHGHTGRVAAGAVRVCAKAAAGSLDATWPCAASAS